MKLPPWNFSAQKLIIYIVFTILQNFNSGFSDPYCMLGIMPGRRLQNEEGCERTSVGSSDEENSPSPKERERKGHGFRFSLKKKGRSGALRDLLPAKYIQTTSVRPNTLNPEWNERFRL